MIEMDADLSHDPAVLPELVAAVEGGADLAIGSRYVPGGADPRLEVAAPGDLAWRRPLRGTMLGLSVHDATAGFRAYHRDNLSRIDLDHVRADGYGFQVEMTYLSPSATTVASSRCRSRSATAVWAARRCRAASWWRRSCWSRGGRSVTGSRQGVKRVFRGTDAWPSPSSPSRVRSWSHPRASCSCATSGATVATDWSTPGGVIDPTDASLHAGLAREVVEETGLVVTEWEGPLYEVAAVAPRAGLGHAVRGAPRASRTRATLVIDDPDGIVVEATFAPPTRAPSSSPCAPWVREPLVDWIEHRWGPDDARTRTTCRHLRRLVVRADRARRAPLARSRPGCRACRRHAARARGTRRGQHPARRPRRVLRVGRAADDPTLRGPAGDRRRAGRRGVVAAASYEAREFGVYSATPMARARRPCPDGVFLAPRFDRYGDVSREVMAILKSYTPLVEPISLDEAFLDVEGARRLLGTGPEIAAAIRAAGEGRHRARRVGGGRHHQDAGQAGERPLQARRSARGRARHRARVLHPLGVRRLWGVGPATERKLTALGVTTVGDLAALPEDTLVLTLGRAAGHHLHELAWNRDGARSSPTRR